MPILAVNPCVPFIPLLFPTYEADIVPREGLERNLLHAKDVKGGPVRVSPVWEGGKKLETGNLAPAPLLLFFASFAGFARGFRTTCCVEIDRVSFFSADWADRTGSIGIHREGHEDLEV